MKTRVDIIPVSNKVVNERNRLCYMKGYPMRFELTRVGRWLWSKPRSLRRTPDHRLRSRDVMAFMLPRHVRVTRTSALSLIARRRVNSVTRLAIHAKEPERQSSQAARRLVVDSFESNTTTGIYNMAKMQIQRKNDAVSSISIDLAKVYTPCTSDHGYYRGRTACPPLL